MKVFFLILTAFILGGILGHVLITVLGINMFIAWIFCVIVGFYYGIVWDDIWYKITGQRR